MINFIYIIQEMFNNIDKNGLKIMKKGLSFCFFILLISIIILITYLLLIDNIFIYKIGILIFQLSISFSIDVVIACIVTDTIKKQLM